MKWDERKYHEQFLDKTDLPNLKVLQICKLFNGHQIFHYGLIIILKVGVH